MCVYVQFVVYSGYYFVLTLVFVSAGVYKLTSIGWRNSVQLCWMSIPPRLTDNGSVQEVVKNHPCIQRGDQDVTVKQTGPLELQ